MNNLRAIVWHTLICWMRNYIYIGFVIAAIALIGFAFVCANIAGLFQVRIFIDSSMFFIELISLITAVFLGATTIIKDTQTKEVYYILSRPISKTQFIIGRFFGTTICVLILHTLINLLFFFIALILKLDIPRLTLFYYYIISSLKIILISSVAFIFSTYSTSFFPSIILTLMSLTMFEFIDSLAYWINNSIETQALRTFYKALFFVLPNFVYYDIFYIFDFTKFGSLFNYTGFIIFYTLIYTIVFLMISLISFNKRSL